MKKKKPSTKKKEYKIKEIYLYHYLPSKSFVTKVVNGSNAFISSRWPAIQRYSWVCEGIFCSSSGLLTDADESVWVVAEDGFDGFLVRVIHLKKCFKNLCRAKQQSFSK